MGEVWLGVDETTRRKVAIKMVNEQYGVAPGAMRRFGRELDAVGRIRHPNVVALRDRGEHDGAPYGVFDYVAGVDLARLAEPLPWQAAAHVAWQLASATAAIHDAGLLHRDIKPANVMISRNGWVTLIDFGLATAIDADDDGAPVRRAAPSDLTQVGSVSGTPRFLAPEVATGARASVQSDIYGFGLVLAHLLGITVNGDGNLGAVNPHIPTALVVLLRRCVAPHPLDRPCSADEIVAELARLERRPARIGTVRAQRHATWSTVECEAPTRAAHAIAA
jgi:serine/threonine protein kinase